MQGPNTSDDGYPDPGPTVAALEKLIAESEGTEKDNRRKTLDAVVYVAHAWQTLVRARETLIAKAIDTVAQDMFTSSWTPVAVEVFMEHTPERKARSETSASHDPDTAVAAEQVTPTPAEAGAVVAADRDRSQAVESAQWRIAQAWDLLEGLQEEAGTEAEKMRFMGIDCFGETHFRVAMVKARMERLKRLE